MKFRSLELDELILSVQKPTRYVGGEVHQIRKELGAAKVTWALCFPDLYEVGMSNLGFRLLYEVLNGREEIACERAFMLWPDLVALARERGLPLWSLESRAPLRDFDILGFSLQFEAAYTTCLAMLELAGVPLLASERTERDPLVIAGGPCTCNGEPVAPFFDAMLLGEGEEASLEVSAVVADWKGTGASRRELLERLSRIPGIYIPAFFQPRYGARGALEVVEPLLPGYERVERRLLSDLSMAPMPVRPILPFMPVIHDRLSIELQRGCTRGCRFCQVGMVARPTRQRPPAEALAAAAEGIACSGHDEVGFLSLSAGDYAPLGELLEAFLTRHAPERVGLSLPSLRTETMSPRLAELVGAIRKSGFTIAPEAATERLRRVINKGNSEENLLQAVQSIFEAGWGLLKLYFMLGLPTESDEDIRAIGELSSRALWRAKRIRSDARLNVSVSTFVPKPFTPFQWEAMDDIPEIIRKHELLRTRFPRKGSAQLKYHGAESSMIEGALARGDRRVADAILSAYRSGQVLDAWTEHFSYPRWEAAFGELERTRGVGRHYFANRERSEAEVLPWEHMRAGPGHEWLLEERHRSRREEPLPDCSAGACSACGVCDFTEIRPRIYECGALPPQAEAGVSATEPDIATLPRRVVRVRYAKRGRAVAVSHIETMYLLHRSIRRAKLPISFSQGFNPRPRLSMGPALAVGVESEAEYFDLDLHGDIEPSEVARLLAPELPVDYELLEAQLLEPRAPSLSSAIAAQLFRVDFPASFTHEQLASAIAAFESADRVEVERQRNAERGKVVDLKGALLRLSLDAPGVVRFTLKAANAASAKPSEVLRTLFGATAGARITKERALFS